MTKMDPNTSQPQKFKILRPNEKLTLDSNPKPLAASNQEDFDNSARIFKSINDVQRFLDVKRSKCSTVLDLFTTSLEAQRMRLKSYCERLMFKDPLAYGREAKDILWKKCYYDVINTAKLLRSDSQWQPDELSCVQIHLQSGIGHYHHILKRFQQEFNISFTERRVKEKGPASSELDHWATSSVYCCLIHLGDLSRYKLDIYPGASICLAAAYYYQALHWRPRSGLPHNQLATLYNSQATYVNAAYHYFRCLNSPKPFEGAACNLRILADKNKVRMRENSTADSIPVYKLMVEHFVQLCYTLYYDMPLKPELKDLFLSYLESCLSDMPPPSGSGAGGVSAASPSSPLVGSEAIVSYTPPALVDVTCLLPDIQRSVTRAQDQCLDSGSLLKIAALTWLLCYRAKKNNSKKLAVCVDLAYQLMGLVVDTTVEKLGQLELEPATPGSGDQSPAPEEDGRGTEAEDMRKILGGCRRRLRRRLASGDSMNEGERERGYYKESNGGGDDSEEEILFDLNLSDEESDPPKPKAGIEPGSPDEDVRSLTDSCFSKKETQTGVLRGFIQLSETENFIQTIRVFVDWLSFDRSLLTHQSPHLVSFMRSYAALLNLLPRAPPTHTPGTGTVPGVATVTSTTGNGRTPHGPGGAGLSRIPLGEDWELRGMPPLHHIHAAYHWDELRMSRSSQVTQAAIRLTRLRDFGALVRAPGPLQYLVYDAAAPPASSFGLHEARQMGRAADSSAGSLLGGDKLLSNGGPGERMNGGGSGGGLHQLSAAPALSEENGVLNLGQHMTQMSNSSSPNHLLEDSDKIGFGSDEDQTNGLQDGEDVMMKNGKNLNNNNNNGSSGPLDNSQHRLLGQAWLRSEMNKLDSLIRHNEVTSFSPLLVLNTEVLASSPALVKQLVYANTFLLVVPGLVIQELDELKRSSGRVRDTIRWLEVQLRSGNRFLRTQRANERRELPPSVQYPKKKDKETWNLFQILELCYHLASRFKPTTDSGSPAPPADSTSPSPAGDKMVTLLIGQDKSSVPSSVLGVAAAAGIELENIGTFYANWKALCKSPG